METTNTVMYYSHYGKDVWEQVTKDTYERKAIDRTAEALGLDHHVVFNMRHKILKTLEDTEEEEPIELGEVSELDETFVLESYMVPQSQKMSNKKGFFPQLYRRRLFFAFPVLRRVCWDVAPNTREANLNRRIYSW